MNLDTTILSTSIYWQLPILIIVISLVYSATRFDQWGAILKETVRWIFNMAAFMGGIGVVLFAVDRWLTSN